MGFLTAAHRVRRAKTPKQLIFLTVAPGFQCATSDQSVLFSCSLRPRPRSNSFQPNKPRLTSFAHGAGVTMDHGRWTMDDGPWTMDHGRWTMDDGPWTMDHGRWTTAAPPIPP